MNRGTCKQQLDKLGPRYCLDMAEHVLKDARYDLLLVSGYARAAGALRLVAKVDAALAAVRSAIKSQGGAIRHLQCLETRNAVSWRRFSGGSPPRD